MPTEYATRSRIAIDRGRAEAALDFDRAAGKGKARAEAARRLAVIYRVTARHPYRTRHYNPAGADAPLPTPDELRLELSGDPERVARFLSAVPRYLARVEALATKAARTYGRWARSADAAETLEYVDAGGRRAYAARFRAAAFEAAADFFGISALPRYVNPAAPMWDQAARVAWDLVKAEGPVNLYAMHDEDEAAELLAAADDTPNVYAEAHDRESAELVAAELGRSVRLFAALDGEELPADEAPVEEAAAEDVVEDQEDEELPLVPLTRVQRRWLHTAAAHPEGHFPNGCNLRTLAALEAAGCVEIAPRYAWGRRVRIADSLKPNPGVVQLSAAGRRRAAREERERVVIVACGGRKAVYADGIHKGKPVIGARAGELYVGSYHRAMRRAADVLTRGGRGGRVLILSARWGLVELDRHILNYDLKAGDPGTVDGETLRRQAHEPGISGAAVTVLGGRAYTELAGEVWDDFAALLAGTRGIGEQLARLADIYDPARTAAEDVVEPVEEAAAEDVIEDQKEELLDSPAPVRPVELVPAAVRRGLSRPLSRGLSAPVPLCGVTWADSPFPPAVRPTRQAAGSRGGGGCPSNRWTVARREDGPAGIGHGGRVHRPVITLAAAALAVLATGCVSVPADGKAPVQRSRPVVSAAPSPASITQAPAREELTRTAPDPSPPSASSRHRAPRTAALTPRAVRPAPVVRPAAPPQGRRVEPSAPPRRTHRPPVASVPRGPARRPADRPPTAPTYSMRDVCRAAQGVTDPVLVTLCRNTYGG